MPWRDVAEQGQIVLVFHGADVHISVHDSRIAALVRGKAILRGQSVAAGIDGETAGEQLHGLGWSAVIAERTESGIVVADKIAVIAIGQSAAAAGANEIVGAGGIHGPEDVVLSGAGAAVVVVGH